MDTPKAVKHGQDLIGNQLRVTGRASERVQADGPLRIRWIKNHNIAKPALRNASQNVVDELAFRVDDNHSPAGGHVLDDQVQENRALAGAGRPDDVQVLESVGDREAKLTLISGRCRLRDDATVTSEPSLAAK